MWKKAVGIASIGVLGGLFGLTYQGKIIQDYEDQSQNRYNTAYKEEYARLERTFLNLTDKEEENFGGAEDSI